MEEIKSNLEEFRSEEVQELLERPPRWIIRWGTTVSFAVMLITFIVAWVIHYPDIVKVPFKITTLIKTRNLKAMSDGYIIKLFVHDGQAVKLNDTLAFFESNANHNEVLQLSEELYKLWFLRTERNAKYIHIRQLHNYYQLGDMQSKYEKFRKFHREINEYLSNTYSIKKRITIEEEIKKLNLFLSEFNIQSIDKYSKNKIYNYYSRSNHHQDSLYSNRRLKGTLKFNNGLNSKYNEFIYAFVELKNAIDDWKNKHILIAPVTGRVLFDVTTLKNKFFTTNQIVFHIQTLTKDYIGEIYISQNDISKVTIGQDVIVKFVGYPYQEFGYIKGKIGFISDLLYNDSLILAKVIFPLGLKTTSGIELKFRNGMAASAEVITDDTRLAQKLIHYIHK